MEQRIKAENTLRAAMIKWVSTSQNSDGAYLRSLMSTYSKGPSDGFLLACINRDFGRVKWFISCVMMDEAQTTNAMMSLQ